MPNMNTTTSISRLSTVLAKKCEKTQQNIKALAKKAGCAPDVPFWNVKIMPDRSNKSEDVIPAGMNGASFYFLCGQTVVMPEPILKILEQSEYADMVAPISKIVEEAPEAPKKAVTRKKKAEEAVEPTEEA